LKALMVKNRAKRPPTTKIGDVVTRWRLLSGLEIRMRPPVFVAEVQTTRNVMAAAMRSRLCPLVPITRGTLKRRMKNKTSRKSGFLDAMLLVLVFRSYVSH
jgi:hypothetical protein